MIRWSARVSLVAILLVLLASVPGLAAGEASSPSTVSAPWPIVLAWLVPLGLGLLACGAVHPDHVASVIRTGWLALGVSVIGYWLCGFAFQFGGLGFVSDQPDLAGLAREWTWAPLDAAWGNKWGLLGLEGYLLQGPASTPAALELFLAQLPWITTAVAVPLWSLQGRAKPFTLFLSSILIASVYALLANWIWGGGWLSGLGMNLGFGHGFVDFGGAGAVHLAGAASALAGTLAFGIRTFAQRPAVQLSFPALAGTETHHVRLRSTPEGEPYVPMPALYLPTLATLGAGLAIIGWVGWALSTPASIAFHANVAWTEMLVTLLLAIAGGAITNLAFSWLLTGQGNALMAARSAVAALIAVSACLPFVPSWAALAVGGGAGLLVPLIQYLVEHVFRLDDPTSAVATHGIPAIWGLLAAGLFADGRAGQGWNQIGGEAYLGVSGQGVSGYLVAPGYVSDWPGQFQAQVTGIVTVCVVAFFASWLLFAAVQGLSRAWQGEYTIRLPRRPRPRWQPGRVLPRRWPKIRLAWKAAEQEDRPAGTEQATPGSSGRWSRVALVLASWYRRLVDQFGQWRARGSRASQGSNGPEPQPTVPDEEPEH